ncbi:lysozyme C [Bombina bombina]|uniref:lysozyme C n=1 Tax=Bombina bombina TaxID=8345 RepID=UPI00235AF19F|nr:lysozyme C [Bombina bombina]
MKTATVFLFLAATIINSQAIERCVLVEALRNAGDVSIKGYTIADYVCLASYASHYDTSLNISATEYGIFQINGYWWCDDKKSVARKNLCGVLCTDLLNHDLEDDIKCAKRVVQDPKGFNAWIPWVKYCKGKNLDEFVAGC